MDARGPEGRCVTMPAMFGKKVEEYVRFERWILILIVVVFALRLGLSLAGVGEAKTPINLRWALGVTVVGANVTNQTSYPPLLAR